MHNYEITVRPLSEEATASGFEPFAEQVDAFVLGAVRGEEDENATTITELQGPTILWGAVINLMENLMKSYPEATAAALSVAMDRIKAEKDKETQNREDEGHESLQDHC